MDISIPGYVDKVLHKFQHKPPINIQHAPHTWTQPIYGKHRQYTPDPDTTPKLDKKETKYIQGVVGSLLYYARAIESPMFPALNEIATTQAQPTEHTKQQVKMLLDYIASHKDAKIRFYASDMILHVETDAAYLVLPNAKSRIAGYYFLSNQPLPSPARPDPKPNGPILIECKTLRHVVASAAEAECGGLFHNGQMAVPIRQLLIDIGHPQPPTPLKTDNSTASNFTQCNMKQKKSKSWDMRYNWLRCRETQQQLRIYWDRGTNNLADYFTKHHPPKHHIHMRPYFLHMCNNITNRFMDFQMRNKQNSGSGEGVLISRLKPTYRNPVITYRKPVISFESNHGQNTNSNFVLSQLSRPISIAH